MDLSIVREREKLKANKKAEPCWQRIKPGCYLGFVPSAKGGQGTWVARAYDEETRRYLIEGLGSLPRAAWYKKFTAAKTEAERFADKIGSGGHLKRKLKTSLTLAGHLRKCRPEDGAWFPTLRGQRRDSDSEAG